MPATNSSTDSTTPKIEPTEKFILGLMTSPSMPVLICGDCDWFGPPHSKALQLLNSTGGSLPGLWWPGGALGPVMMDACPDCESELYDVNGCYVFRRTARWWWFDKSECVGLTEIYDSDWMDWPSRSRS